MTPLELRIIAYAIFGLFVIGGSAWGGHTLTARHYEALITRDKKAQDEALLQAQQKVIVAQAERAAATQQVEKAHELLVQADSASRAAVVGSVRNLETALHLGSLSAAMGNPGQFGRASPGTGSDPELERAIAGFNTAADKAIAASQHDSAELTSILALAPKVIP